MAYAFYGIWDWGHTKFPTAGETWPKTLWKPVKSLFSGYLCAKIHKIETDLVWGIILWPKDFCIIDESKKVEYLWSDEMK